MRIRQLHNAQIPATLERSADIDKDERIRTLSEVQNSFSELGRVACNECLPRTIFANWHDPRIESQYESYHRDIRSDGPQ